MVSVIAAVFFVLVAISVAVATRRPRLNILVGSLLTGVGALALVSVSSPGWRAFAPPMNPWVTMWIGMLAVLVGSAFLAGAVIRWSLNHALRDQPPSARR